jgi:hypothetical protein
MAYEVSAASEQTDRLVVSVGGVSLVYGEALEQDRDAEGVVIVAEQENSVFSTDSVDIAGDLALLSERVPEIAEAVKVEYVADPIEEEAPVEQLQVEVGPAPDPADQVVPAGETTPSVERVETEVEDAPLADTVVDEADRAAREGFENEGGAV